MNGDEPGRFTGDHASGGQVGDASVVFLRPLFHLLIGVLLLLVFLCRSFASSRQKTDIVFMRNGDRVTCEIRSLDKGQLTVKPKYTNSSIVLDWAEVDHIESSQQFFVKDPHGVTYSGSLSGEPKTTAITIVKATNTTLPHDSVIQIEPLGETFLRQLHGNIDLGLSFARSNGQKNLTLQGGLGQQSEKHILSFNANSQFTTQKETSNTNELTIKTGLFRQVDESNWYGGAIANFLSSSEQQISLRSTLGGGLVRRVLFTNRSDITALGGLGYTIERDTPGSVDTARKQSLDSAFALQSSIFRFDSTTFNTTLWLYPSLTTPGRVRMTLNQDVYYKFLGDFYIRLSLYDNYDNRSVAGTPANNFGGSTTVGWSFR